ncbi:hypothetical protein AOQ72_04390 [Bradyrhizobium yuanmingense]|uniref:DUF3892 domain-containing protein n=1 Tax=Bradyrhizobium yuanmingense TaxID=108015 RepID=A0A0R3BKF4_9BRAD|nr:DUF3892 domain-containing protein [Bradyrhizobium yuanmingense]KRP85882.1 hypothetical protein AOQ72_04390 [Bradyrhizobium yuanmingense]
MATDVQVQCITKHPSHHDPHARIQGIGGVHNGQRWWMTEDDAIRHIENGTYSFFVMVNGRRVDVVVAQHKGRKYLKTTADGYAPNNLLNLPECPR